MKRILSVLALLAVVCSCQGPSINSISKKVFALADYQYVNMDKQLTNETFPRTYQDGKLITSDQRWWTSGFFAGSLWYIYENRPTDTLRFLAAKNTYKLTGLVNDDVKTDHDIGFQVMCSFGNAYRLTKEDDFDKYIALASLKLYHRFSDTTGTVKSWDNNRWEWPVIIDNMMNLELLMAGSKSSGSPTPALKAKSHANKTMDNHYRDDYTCWHLVNYDPHDGHVIGKQTVQGYSDDSAWARGQAWGFYGFSMMFRESRDLRYLEHAENIARMLLKRLPEDGIPYWDFDAPDIPNALRDASAGAIMASAFIEMSTQTRDKELAKACLNMAKKQIRTLASDEYLAKKGENGYFILKHSVGSLPGNSEVDVPLTYADYYFLEALTRYNRLKK